jgi:hypothetical protein
MGDFGFAEGLAMMVDDQQRFLRSGLEVFLRVQNFQEQGTFQEVGIPVAPTGAAAAQTGFTDILIDPPPQVTDVSMHDIGMSGGRLLIGARKFKISQSFVTKMRARNPSIADDIAVWNVWDNQATVLCIMYENRAHDIVHYTHTEIGGSTVSWFVFCNRVDIAQDAGAQQPNSVPSGG